jgi:hypothetical protein
MTRQPIACPCGGSAPFIIAQNHYVCKICGAYQLAEGVEWNGLPPLVMDAIERKHEADREGRP